MKKIPLIISIFCTTLYVQGQNNSDFRPQLGIGFQGGINRSSVIFDPSIKQAPVNLQTYGLVLNYISEKYLGVQVELNMTQRGWSESQDSLGSYSRTINYFEIPIMTHIYAPIKKFRINFDLGPYISFFNSYTEKYDKNLRHNPADDTIRPGEIRYYGVNIDNTFDYGFVAGIGVGYHSILGEFQFRFRFTQGLTSIFYRYPESSFNSSESRSYCLGFSYFYTFTFKGKR
jgi:hypothetical protein